MKMKIKLALSAFCMLLASFANAREPGEITSAFDGNWFDPANAGQGFVFETFPQANGETILFVIFFTYDAQGRQQFFTAQDIVKPGRMRMTLLRPFIQGPLSNNSLPPPMYEPAGTLDLEFDSCSIAAATVTFNQQNGGELAKIRVGTGSFGLRRLGATTQAKRCTGGISDNVFATDVPVGVDQSVSLSNMDLRLKYERRPDASEFRIELSDLPVGTYQLFVDNIARGQTEVTANADGDTRGVMILRSPELPFTDRLDFLPNAKPLTIRGVSAGNQNVVQSFLFSQQLRPLVDTGGFTQGPGELIERTFEQEQVLEFSGVSSTPFKFNVESSSFGLNRELRIQSEGVPVGNYDVFVNQTRVGPLRVEQRANGKTFGEIVLRAQVSPGSYPLEFEPNGAQVELRNTSRQPVYQFTLNL